MAAGAGNWAALSAVSDTVPVSVFRRFLSSGLGAASKSGLHPVQGCQTFRQKNPGN